MFSSIYKLFSAPDTPKPHPSPVPCSAHTVSEDAKSDGDDFLADAVIVASESEENLNSFLDKVISSGLQSHCLQTLESIQNEVRKRNKELVTLQLKQQTRMARQQELQAEVRKEEEDLKQSHVHVQELASVGRCPEAELISQRIVGITTFVCRAASVD